ncbi:hypothetical protein HUJ05_001475 [Dendroctonus ponderosae]|nr:hypothetical protein HUJ05_001475 [Dendroctonus ponderosae]
MQIASSKHFFGCVVSLGTTSSFAQAETFVSDLDLTCKGKTFHNVTLTAYFPDYTDSDNEFGYQDKKGRKLRTLQQLSLPSK